MSKQLKFLNVSIGVEKGVLKTDVFVKQYLK